MRRQFVRCIATTRDGSRCGRMAPADTQICSAHSRQPSGCIPPSDQIDEIAILKKLARDSNPQVRLRAVDLLLSLKDKGQDEARRHDYAPFLKALTQDERTELINLVDALHDFKERIYAREPELRLDWETPPPRQTQIDATLEEPTVPVAPVEPVAVADPLLHDLDEAPPYPRTVAQEHWESVGLFEQNGVITHARGDVYAAQILSGEIPFDDAKAHHDAARRQAERLIMTNSR